MVRFEQNKINTNKPNNRSIYFPKKPNSIITDIMELLLFDVLVMNHHTSKYSKQIYFIYILSKETFLCNKTVIDLS